VTRSFSGYNTKDIQGLSQHAQQQIYKLLVAPILREASLKEFHPLVRDVPERIDTKDITTLRDLEKTLIYLAPVSIDDNTFDLTIAYWRFVIQDYSKTPAHYRFFCETSIRCLHLTVNGVHESEQCLPSDRPYSPGYFVDLVEQIRRYAAILAATREKRQRGEAVDEMDATSYANSALRRSRSTTESHTNNPYRDERIELQGGLSHDGKPAYLTRSKDGQKHISLATNKPTKDVITAPVKRQMEVVTNDEGALRSMARRKKDAPIRTYTCNIDGCRKHFKRPCDLTKHIKTHERPYKCPDETCKYHNHGWPTEKERDRHYNDKHSDAPSQYKCLFEDCPYTSKRESNCKQHMEKSHGWAYVRSKNNGKGKAIASVTRIPQAATPSSSGAEGSTPASLLKPSPLTPFLSESDRSRADSVAPTERLILPEDPCMFDFGQDFPDHFNTDVLGSGLTAPFTPAWSDDRGVSAGSSLRSPFGQPDGTFESSFELQQLTPNSSNPNLSAPPTTSAPNSAAQSGWNAPIDDFSPHITSGGEDLTLTSDHFYDTMHMDEGFGEGMQSDADFQLFEGGGNNQPLFADQAGLGIGSQFDMNFQASDFDVSTLFPELSNQQ